MKPKIKKKWLKALRSGEYVQGICQLRDEDNRFCCLGVLCNLHAIAHPEIAAKETNQELYLYMRATLPKQVQDWAGLDNVYGDIVTKKSTISLALLNDRGTSFKEIADIIEKHL